MLVNDLGTELLSTAVEAHELAALRSAINTVEGLEGLDQGLLQVRLFVRSRTVPYMPSHATPRKSLPTYRNLKIAY